MLDKKDFFIVAWVLIIFLIVHAVSVYQLLTYVGLITVSR